MTSSPHRLALVFAVLFMLTSFVQLWAAASFCLLGFFIVLVLQALFTDGKSRRYRR